MSDLLVTTHTPVLRSGQAMRTYGIARALAAGGGLRLLYVRFDAPEPDAAFKAIPGIEFHDVLSTRGLRRMLTYGRARLARVPDGFARGISPELGRAAARLSKSTDTGRVVADGPIAAAALAGLARARPVIYNAHNVESAFRGDLSDSGSGDPQALRRFERGILARASESWMVSEADIRSARELCPQAHLRLAPNVVDVSAIEPVSELPGEQQAIFVANFAYEPNRNGLRFLLEEVFPRVWDELPRAHLTLAGAGLDAPEVTAGFEGLRDPRVQALGFVDDLAGAYRRARCAVVPLLQGGGSPLKLVEALAYGLPVVATAKAVAGLEARDGEHCLVADGATEFASALVRVLRDGAPQIAHAGRLLAERCYSIEALTALLQRQGAGGAQLHRF